MLGLVNCMPDLLKPTPGLMNSIKEPCCLQVTAEHVAVRLDRFLDDSLPELTRSQIKRLIDEGAVTLDGVKSKAGINCEVEKKFV